MNISCGCGVSVILVLPTNVTTYLLTYLISNCSTNSDSYDNGNNDYVTIYKAQNDAKIEITTV